MRYQTQSLAAMETLLREVRPRYLRPKLSVRVKGARMDEREKDAFDAVRSHLQPAATCVATCY